MEMIRQLYGVEELQGYTYEIAMPRGKHIEESNKPGFGRCMEERQV